MENPVGEIYLILINGSTLKTTEKEYYGEVISLAFELRSDAYRAIKEYHSMLVKKN